VYKNSKRIIFFHKRLLQLGGAERLLISESNELSNMGCKVIIASFYIDQNIKKLFAKNISIIEFGGIASSNSLMELKCLYSFYKFCRIHRNYTYITASGIVEVFMMSKLTGLKYIYEDHHPITMSPIDYIRSSFQMRKAIHEYYPKSELYNAPKNFKIATLKSLYLSLIFHIYYRAYHGAHKVLVLSVYAKREKRLLLGIEADILQGGVDELLLNDIQSNEIEDKTIISLSRLHSKKNISLLIDAFDLSCLSAEGYKLKIYGQGSEKDVLDRKITKKGLSDSVFLKGYLRDGELFSTLLKAEVFVNLEYVDFNLTLIEALATDIKIVNTEECYVNPILDDIATIIRSDINSPDIVSQALIDIVSIGRTRQPKILKNKVASIMSWKVRAKKIMEYVDDQT
jgi:glycosyltransferase involved in cell wall biosynthesis